MKVTDSPQEMKVVSPKVRLINPKVRVNRVKDGVRRLGRPIVISPHIGNKQHLPVLVVLPRLTPIFAIRKEVT